MVQGRIERVEGADGEQFRVVHDIREAVLAVGGQGGLVHGLGEQFEGDDFRAEAVWVEVVARDVVVGVVAVSGGVFSLVEADQVVDFPAPDQRVVGAHADHEIRTVRGGGPMHTREHVLFRSPEGVDALRPQVADKHFVAPGIGQGDDQIVGQLRARATPHHPVDDGQAVQVQQGFAGQAA